MEGTKLIESNPFFEQEAKNAGVWSREVMEKVAEQGSVAHFPEFPESIRNVFVTAHDITPVDHIKMQAAFQKHTDNAVSKTVNFSNEATVKDVEDVFILAYTTGCKGVTVYRDGSRDEQVLSTKKIEGKPQSQQNEPVKTIPKKRPSLTRGGTRLMKTGCGHLYVTINEDENGKPFEVFTNIGKAGGCASSQAEAIGRLISLALRSNIETEEIVKQLKGISCHQPSWYEDGRLLSCSDAIAKALEGYIPVGTPAGENGNGKSKYREVMLIGACPECGGTVQHEEGCAKCHNCGFTKC